MIQLKRVVMVCHNYAEILLRQVFCFSLNFLYSNATRLINLNALLTLYCFKNCRSYLNFLCYVYFVCL
jgi:hypothetical protein